MSSLGIRLFALAALLLASASTQAQLFRAYVSGSGNDANPCTLQSPCRLLPRALQAVADGGEIWMVGSANYNTSTVVVTKSVRILAIPGEVGSIVAQNFAPAISVPADGIRVTLSNVVIGPVVTAAPGTEGILVTGASTVSIDNSTIAWLSENAIVVDGFGDVVMTNTTVHDIQGYAVVLVNGASADISGSRMFVLTGGGVYVGGSAGSSRASVSDSFITTASSSGVVANAGAGASARITLTRSTITRTIWPLDCFGPGSNSIYAGGNLIAHNETAYYADCDGVYTHGNNQFDDNGPPIGSLTPRPLL